MEEVTHIVVSVVIPVYNAEKYIEKTVESILEQTFQAYEIILINDGSTDRTWSVLSKLKEKDTRIIAIDCPNGGPSKARNIGIKKARGTWIQFMDSDDYIEPDMMQSHYNCVIANKTDVVVSGVIRENVLTNERSRKNLTHAKLYNRGDIARYLELLDIESHDLLLNYVWNKWIRKQVIDNNNLTFRESWRWSEDYLFNCSMFHFISSLCILGDAFYHYCIQGNESLVKKFDVNTLSRIKIMDQALAKMYESYGIKDNCNYFMMCNSGRCCLNAIYKVCTPSCQLSLKAKHAYIKDFLMNERGQAIQCYLNSLTGKRKIKNLPTIIGCKMKNSHIMYLLALLRSRKQYVADIYYSGRKRR